jgi:hypothetical protein
VIYRINLGEAPYESETVVRNLGETTARTDGVHLYFYNNQGELLRADPDGGNVVRLPVEQAVNPAFDEEYLYYCRYDRNDEEAPLNGGVYRLKKDLSAEPESLFKLPNTAYIYPLYQSDILFISTEENGETCFYTVRNDGSDLVRISVP